MSRTRLLSTAALGAALLAGAGHAQTGMNQTLSDPVAPLPQQQQAARQLDAGAAQRDIMSLLRQSEQAVAAGNWARANEYLERAQTTFLNTHALTGDARQASGNMGSLGEAGRAISNRNRGEAMRALQAAMGEMGRVGADMGTGSGAGMAPAQGGAHGGAHGGAMMHDRGMGSRTMSRADSVGVLPRLPRSGVLLAQGGGGSSGGLSGSTPGSPGVGMQGSTPAVRPETPQQPGQTAAVPGANVPGGAGSAPGAGPEGAPRPGSGGIGVGTDQQGRTVTPTTPGGSTTR